MFFTPATAAGAGADTARGDTLVFNENGGTTPKTPRLALFKPDLLEGADFQEEAEVCEESVNPEELVKEIKQLRVIFIFLFKIIF